MCIDQLDKEHNEINAKIARLGHQFKRAMLCNDAEAMRAIGAQLNAAEEELTDFYKSV